MNLIDGIRFNGNKSTDDRRITLTKFTRLVKALLTLKLGRLGLLVFARHPLDEECRVVVGDKVVVEVLLHEVGGDEVLESDERVVLFIGNYHSGDLAKGRKDLKKILSRSIYATYMFEVLLHKLKARRFDRWRRRNRTDRSTELT